MFGRSGFVIGWGEAHRELRLGRVVSRAVRRFEHGDAVDPIADPGRDEREQVRKSGIHPASEHRSPALLTGTLDPLSLVLGQGMTGNEARRRRDVDPRLEEAHQLVGVRPLRVVADAVRLEGDQRLDVIRREDARGCDTGQLAGVATDLFVAPGVATDELELRMRDDRAQAGQADVAGGPLDDSECHGDPSRSWGASRPYGLVKWAPSVSRRLRISRTVDGAEAFEIAGSASTGGPVRGWLVASR